jgi:hypothetical protein
VPSLTPTSLPPTSTPTPTPSVLGAFELVTQPSSQDASKTDVYIRNSNTGEESLFITLEDVYTRHYHNSEYHNGNLYIIRRIGYEEGSSDEEWSDELWRYDSQGKGTCIYSTKGLDFRVAPDESHIAVRDSPSESEEARLAFLSSQGNLVQGFTVDQLGDLDFPDPPHISALKWSDDGGALWGALQMGPRPQAFWRVMVGSWQVDTYDVLQLPIQSEYDLNANIGKLAYSDYPAMYDVQSAEEFEESKQPVTLFVYDFDGQSTQEIATSVAKPFNPTWLDDSSIECDSPDEEGRIVYTVSSIVETGQDQFTDPFTYCAAVGTIDVLDERYTDPEVPEEIVEALREELEMADDAPTEWVAAGTCWRCMDGKVWACFVGANLPCYKADTSRAPSPEMKGFCEENPTSDFIPAHITGRETIYQWRCTDGAPEIVKELFKPDAQGFLSDYWYELSPPAGTRTGGSVRGRHTALGFRR